MKRNSIRLLTAALLLVGAQQAFADNGTNAGVTVTNTATVNYKVGTVAQTATGDSVDFVVDRRINLAVASNGNTTVAPNSTGQVLAYTVTNSTNDVMDFGLSAAVGSSPDFSATSLQVFVEDGTTVGYQPLEDTATYIDELAEDGTKIVYVVGSIPANATDTQTGPVVLTATAKAGGTASTEGAASVADTDGDDAALVENVFADGTGATDSARDGKQSASGSYVVASATISVTKTSLVVSDPFNSTTNPKAIPGAVIEYCISVANGGGTAASDVKVDDAIPTNTTYVLGSIKVGTNCTYASATAEDDDAAGADESDGVSGSKDGSGVHTEVTALAGSATTTTLFHVTVD